MMGPDVKLGISLIGAPIILVIVIVMLVRDIRLIRRREPIKHWLSDTVTYQDDPGYWFAVFQRVIPYGALVGLPLIIAIILVWNAF